MSFINHSGLVPALSTWRAVWVSLICVAVACCAARLDAASGKGHAGLSCRSCHNAHYPRGKHLFSQQPPQQTERGTKLLAGEALCYSCHKGSAKGHFFEPGSSHPINVVPSARVTVPRELGTTYVAGLGAVITCTSCHTPHGSSPKLLKITDEDDRLCLACHRYQ